MACKRPGVRVPLAPQPRIWHQARSEARWTDLTLADGWGLSPYWEEFGRSTTLGWAGARAVMGSDTAVGSRVRQAIPSWLRYPVCCLATTARAPWHTRGPCSATTSAGAPPATPRPGSLSGRRHRPQSWSPWPSRPAGPDTASTSPPLMTWSASSSRRHRPAGQRAPHLPAPSRARPR